MSKIQKHVGSCHCGAVRFEATLDATAGSRCNCTVCTKSGTLTTIVKPDAFTLLTDPDALAMYEWGGKTARRYSCKLCSVMCFARGYLEQVGGDYVSINLLALDDVEIGEIKVSHWDGRHNNWEAGLRARLLQ